MLRFSRVESAALAAVVGAALWAGLALPQIHHPLGSDWAQYFTVAEILWHEDTHLYPPFRKPLFGMLLGVLGEHTGYLQAAQILGRLSVVVMVLAAGLGAWALVGPLAAVGAAFTAVLMPLVMDGGLWVNNYPLLGASCSVAFAAGAAVSRWPRMCWAALAGLGAGAAYALDVRGVTMIPAVCLLLALGLPWGQWRTVGLLCIALGLPMGSLAAYDGWLARTHEIPQFSLDGQLRVQRQAVLEPIRRGQYADDPELAAACANAKTLAGPQQPLHEALDIWTEGTCAQALSTYSYTPLRDNKVLPGPLTLGLLLLTLLPMAWTRKTAPRGGRARSTLASLVVFGLPALSVVVGMGWVFHYDRYLMPSAAVIAMLVPVGLGRAGSLIPREAPRLRWVAASGALAWAILIWPGVDARDLQSPEAIRNADYAAGVMAQWAKEEIQEGDRVFDCGGLAMDYLLLPRRIAYVRHPPGDPSCEALIRSPGVGPGRTYLITPVLPGQDGLAARPTAIGALGWSLISPPAELTGYRLWLHRGE
jgi:hypothetical protein